MNHCPLTYKSLVLLPDDGDNYDILPCCLYRGNITLETNDLNYEFIHGGMNDLRKRLDSGERVDECHECWVKEDLGLKSMRQYAIEKYGEVSKPDLKFIEFELDNTCNLKCNICSSGRSTAWIKEEVNLFGKSAAPAYNTTLYKSVDFSKLETVKLIGGEPLLSKNIADMCDRIIDSKNLGNLEIIASTNGTLIPNGVVEEVFLNCRLLSLNISIDATEELFNFIRIGANWDKVLENLKYFYSLFEKRTGNTMIYIHSVITPYNVNYMHKLDEFFETNFPKFQRSKDVLTTPDFMSLMALPNDYKKYVRSYLEEKEYYDLLGYTHGEDQGLFNYFVAWHNKLLKITNVDFSKVNPELDQLISNFEVTPINDSELFIKRGTIDV